jgi:hypothetical protein
MPVSLAAFSRTGAAKAAPQGNSGAAEYNGDLLLTEKSVDRAARWSYI